jgi:hypothetical protein
MTISLCLLLLFPLFLIPALLLPSNRMRVYTIAAATGFGLIALEIFLSVVSGGQLEQILGKVFMPLYGVFLNAIPTLSVLEKQHLSFFFLAFASYFVAYFAAYLIQKQVAIGTNPNIQKPATKISHVLSIIAFLVFTYGGLCLYIIETRELLPLRDGLLAPFFQVIYPIEA